MSKYSLAIFDFDNTLVSFDAALEQAFVATCCRFLPDLLQPQDEVMLFRKINNSVWKDFERNKLLHATMQIERFRRFLRALNQESDPIAMSDYYLDALKSVANELMPGARHLVEVMSKHMTLGVLTNGSMMVQQNRWENFSLRDQFAFLVISEETQWKKPQPEIFHYARSQLKEAPPAHQVLMIGDQLYSDILGGARAGFDTCWYNYRRQSGSAKVRPTYCISDLTELCDLLSLD